MTDGSHALDDGSIVDRDAKIEQLLLAGLDHYFSGAYEQAINVWTRALFLDRGHARARAYIERARSALAERQRRSEELLQDGVAAFQRGDGGEARRLLRAAIDEGAPADEALTVLNRLDRLERAEAPVPAGRQEATRPEVAPRRSIFDPPPPAPAPRRRLPGAVILVVLLGALAAAGALASARGWRWAAWLTLTAPPPPASVDPGPRTPDLPVPRRGEIVLARAEALAAGGRLHDALAALDRIRLSDPERADAERLRVEIQRELLALAEVPAASDGAAAPQEIPNR